MNKWRSGKDLGFYDPNATDKDAEVTIKASVLNALRVENSHLRSALKEIGEFIETLKQPCDGPLAHRARIYFELAQDALKTPHHSATTKGKVDGGP
jgi:hypothetical protein